MMYELLARREHILACTLSSKSSVRTTTFIGGVQHLDYEPWSREHDTSSTNEEPWKAPR
jgi:hypothetical protein